MSTKQESCILLGDAHWRLDSEHIVKKTALFNSLSDSQLRQCNVHDLKHDAFLSVPGGALPSFFQLLDHNSDNATSMTSSKKSASC